MSPTYEYKCNCGRVEVRRNMPISATSTPCECGENMERNPINRVPFKPCRGMASYYYQNRGESNG